MTKYISSLLGFVLCTFGFVVIGSPPATAISDINTQRIGVISTSTDLTVRLPASNPYDDAPPVPRDGYVITLSRVADIDLTEPSEYQRVSDFTYDDVEGMTKEQVAVQTTDHTGNVSFNDLPPALYVIETVAPSGRSGAMIIDPIAVVLPRASAEGDTWLSHVTVYLKRSSEVTPSTPPDSPTPPKEVPPPPPPKLPWTGAGVSDLIWLAVVCLTFGAGVMTMRKRNEYK